MTAPAVLAGLRAAYGLGELLVPDIASGVRLDQRGRLVARILGVRQLAQAALCAPAPTRDVLAVGSAVDVAHATSMIALAVISPRRRRAALLSAAVAGGFAGAGAVVAGWLSSRRPTATPSGVVGLRDRWAHRLVGRLLPDAALDR